MQSSAQDGITRFDARIRSPLVEWFQNLDLVKIERYSAAIRLLMHLVRTFAVIPTKTIVSES